MTRSWFSVQVLVAVAAAACLFASSASAQVPSLLPVQGYLADDAGVPLSSEVNMVFAIYDVDAGGTPLFTESHTVLVEGGFFSLVLGDVSALDMTIFQASGDAYVGVSLEGATEMAPRMQLMSVPYAAYADFAANAGTVGGVSAGSFASSTVGTGLTVNATNEISINMSVVDGWIDAHAGSTADANTRNHDRYTDAEARSAVSTQDRYVRNTGDVVTGTLTVAAALHVTTGLVEARAGLRANCPVGSTRVGSWCMANFRRNGTITAAMADCNDEGMSVCPVEAILYCATTGGPAHCVDDTIVPVDNAAAGIEVATGSFQANGGAFSRILTYQSRQGILGSTADYISVKNGGSARRYYCCAPIHGL